MIIKQDTLDKVRLHINQLLSDNPSIGGVHVLHTSTYQRALEVAIREAFSRVVESMTLSDKEELQLQSLEEVLAQKEGPVSQSSHRGAVEAVVAMLRTRHPYRTVRKSPGQVLHEAFHTALVKTGDSKYGTGCWNELSISRRNGWEAAASQLATEVVYGRVQLKDTLGQDIVGVQPGGVLGGRVGLGEPRHAPIFRDLFKPRG